MLCWQQLVEEAMFGWLRKRAYRNEALGCVLALFGKWEGGFDKVLLYSYPGIEDAINSYFEDGSTAQLAGVHITAAVMAQTIENQIDISLKERVLQQLAENGKPDEEPEPFTDVIHHMEWLAGHWVKDGKIEERDLDCLISEIVGALRGKPFDERSKDRIIGYTKKAFEHPEDI